MPGEFTIIKTHRNGPGITCFRPPSDLTVVTKGLAHLQKRTIFFVKSGVTVIGHHNYNNVPVTIIDPSNPTGT